MAEFNLEKTALVIIMVNEKDIGILIETKTNWINIINFLFDNGFCWHSQRKSEKQIVVRQLHKEYFDNYKKSTYLCLELKRKLLTYGTYSLLSTEDKKRYDFIKFEDLLDKNKKLSKEKFKALLTLQKL